MDRKLCFYVIILTVFILTLFVSYKVPNTTSSWPQLTMQSSPISSSSPSPLSSSSTSSSSSSTTPPSSTNFTKPLSNNIRRFAIFSSSIHSQLRSYIYYTPITAASWQRIGYDVIVVFTGDFTNTSNASHLPELHLARRFLQRLGVHIIDFQCNISYSIKMSQLVRIFPGFLSDTIVKDTDYILTTDSDMIPIHGKQYLVLEDTAGFIYNAFCCGTFEYRSKTYPMYPMSHICLSKKIWRDLFLQSKQRTELLQSKLTSSETILLSDKAPFSFETISLYTRHEFHKLYDSNMTKGDAAWYMDQTYSSVLINDYFEKYPNITIVKHYKRSIRLDFSLPYHMWEPYRLKNYGDAHIIHDEIFDSYRYGSFRNLLVFLFNSSLAKEFDLYYIQFILNLRDQPEDH